MLPMQVPAMPSFGWVYTPPIMSAEWWWSLYGAVKPYSTDGLLLLVVFLLLIEITVFIRKRRDTTRSGWRGKMDQLFSMLPRMNRKQRKQYLQDRREDQIVEATENDVYLGKQTRDEATEYYLMLADTCGLKGLVPKTSLKELKAQLTEKHAAKRKPLAKTEMGEVFKKALSKTATA